MALRYSRLWRADPDRAAWRFGADYLAPRNLVARDDPRDAVIAVLVASPRTGRAGIAAGAALIAIAFLAIITSTSISARACSGATGAALAHAHRRGAPGDRAITTVELGATPLEYYLHGLHNLHPGTSVRVSEIDETGYCAAARIGAASRPRRAFACSARLDIDGLIVYRFVSPVPRLVSEATLRRHVITLAHPEVLVPADARLIRLGCVQMPEVHAQLSSPTKKI